MRDLRCDACGRGLMGIAAPGSAAGGLAVRFTYHPGDPRMRDDSGTLCAPCWADGTAELGAAEPQICAVCGTGLTRRSSLHLRRLDVVGPAWQLCGPDAARWLNRLRTVDPKFDPDQFLLPLQSRGGVPHA
jgi:hypothetical protein